MSKDILNHELVPRHDILSESEIEKIFKDLDFGIEQLPKIKDNDPVVKAIGAEEGDVLKITRKSPTAGVFIAYRLVES